MTVWVLQVSLLRPGRLHIHAVAILGLRPLDVVPMLGAPPSARLCILRLGWDATALHRKARNHAVRDLVTKNDLSTYGITRPCCPAGHFVVTGHHFSRAANTPKQT